MAQDVQTRQLMHNLSIASQLVFLDEIPRLPEGSKVRLLGCVQSHHIAKAEVVLKTPHQSASSHKKPKLLVSIANVLEIVNFELIQVGAWINVIGYVSRSGPVKVEAIQVWDAGAVRFDQYVNAVKGRQDGATNLATIVKGFE